VAFIKLIVHGLLLRGMSGYTLYKEKARWLKRVKGGSAQQRYVWLRRRDLWLWEDL
jgi:hypothetical protein